MTFVYSKLDSYEGKQLSRVFFVRFLGVTESVAGTTSLFVRLHCKCRLLSIPIIVRCGHDIHINYVKLSVILILYFLTFIRFIWDILISISHSAILIAIDVDISIVGDHLLSVSVLSLRFFLTSLE